MDKSLPSLAGRAAGAYIKEARAIIHRVPPLTESEIHGRMEICRGCDQFDSLETKCNVCGCLLEFKTVLRSAECDLGKWKSLTTQQDSE
jgi:hypothetical protein